MIWTYAVFVLVLCLPWKAQAQCTGEADIVVAVPGSMPQIPRTEFAAFEQGLIDLVSYFRITPANINIGLVLYGSTAVNIASPQPYKTRTQINTRITILSNRMLYMTGIVGGNDVAGAITAVHRMLVEPPSGYSPQILRPTARKIGVIFVYDNVTLAEVPNVIQAAENAKNNGVLLYALNTGVTGQEFQSIGSDVCRLFSMGNFTSGLESAVQYLAAGICAELDSRVAVTTGNCFPYQYSRVTPQAVTCLKTAVGILPDPENCAYFYRCGYQDSHPERAQCALNTIYDPLIDNCNHKDHVACYADLRCPAVKGQYPHPLDCNKYMNCNDDLVPHVQSCPEGTMFDESTEMCNATMLVTCSNIMYL